MKAIFILFDSLAKNYLPPYGCDWVKAPNFERLARKTVTFDNCCVGSLPCMPARRELHTGRYNFLHRSWGPLEPFDDSTPEILKKNGVYTHLVSDHYHYWQDGGATYHNRYNTWESVRGQEGDYWKGEVKDPEVPEHLGHSMRQDWVNRKYMSTEETSTQKQTFDLALEFMETNREQDNWMLHIECFDPHPPFMAPQKYRDLYESDYEGPMFDFPHYAPVNERETPEAVAQCRREYAALISFCDHSLGRVLDTMDRHEMWDDTMLILTTDHGFLLGEHNWWAFVKPPCYDQIARKPLFIWDPRSGRAGERCDQLVQTIDLPATLLEYFGAALPADMQGVPLRETTATDAPAREGGLFGIFGGHVNVTDGRYVYMRAPASAGLGNLYNYTVMPTHLAALFSVDEMRTATLAEPFSFTKNCPLLRIEASPRAAMPGAALNKSAHEFGNLLYDLKTDSEQTNPLDDPATEKRMAELLVKLMKATDAPPEQYKRLGLDVA